jgi:hypothetical protein
MKIMKLKLSLFTLMVLFFMGCSDDDPTEVVIDSSMPQGQFTVTETGTFVAQSGTNSTGTAELGTDDDGTQFLHFGSNFNTNLATGTVTVYLSTSDTFVPDPGNGNPNLLLVGPVKNAGENYFKIAPAAADKFTHVILWCGSASVPFGYASLN